MEITCVSLNLWEGGKLLNEIIAFLKETHADILLLQEARLGFGDGVTDQSRTQDVLQNHLQLPFASFAPAFVTKDTNQTIMMGNLLLSKFKIKQTIEWFFDRSFQEFNTQIRKDFDQLPAILQQSELQLPEITLTVCNIHGIWGENGDDTDRRLQMSQIICDAIRGKQNVILGGDFNVSPNTKTIANIEKQLANVFKNELTTTFNMKHKENQGYKTAVVDMLFVSPHIRVLDHVCPSVDISDHLPLIAKLSL